MTFLKSKLYLVCKLSVIPCHFQVKSKLPATSLLPVWFSLTPGLTLHKSVELAAPKQTHYLLHELFLLPPSLLPCRSTWVRLENVFFPSLKLSSGITFSIKCVQLSRSDNINPSFLCTHADLWYSFVHHSIS